VSCLIPAYILLTRYLLQLVEFLHAPQAPVRAIALENLAPFATPEHRYIFKVKNFEPIKDLKNLLNNKDSVRISCEHCVPESQRLTLSELFNWRPL
jgi:hypothetical protein